MQGQSADLGDAKAVMNPAMDAPWIRVEGPTDRLRAHMERWSASMIEVRGAQDTLDFLRPCADLITTLHLPSEEVRDASALKDLTSLHTLVRPPANVDDLLPALPRLRHLELYGPRDYDFLQKCDALRELTVGDLVNDRFERTLGLRIVAELSVPRHLEMLTLSGENLIWLAGLDRFTTLRTLVLKRVVLRDRNGLEALRSLFGFENLDALVAGNKAQERRLQETDTRFDADRHAVESAPPAPDDAPAVSAEHPACILILLDRSRSTAQENGYDVRLPPVDPTAEGFFDSRFGKPADTGKRHAEMFADAINRYLASLCDRVPAESRGAVHVGIIEYGKRIGWSWSGALEGRDFVTVEELARNPLTAAPNRRWIEPYADGETPLGQAMELGRESIVRWLEKNPTAVPPVVIGVGGVRWTGDDIGRHGWGIRRIATPAGNALLCHIEREYQYASPNFGVEGYRESESKQLFSQASRLPAWMVENLRASGYLFHEPVRGFMEDAAESDVENLLGVFTSFPGMGWRPELVHHPLPPQRQSGESLAESPWTPPRPGERQVKPWKAPKVKGPVTEDVFWKIIDQSRKGVEDGDEQLDHLALLLDQLGEDDLVRWQRLLIEKLALSYRWDLWAVAFIAKGGCSDDGFEYFRAWLIAQGRKYFEDSLADPAKAAKRITPGDEAELEVLLNVASDVYESRTQRADLWERAGVIKRSEPAGEPWEEDNLPKLYPKLVKKYG